MSRIIGDESTIKAARSVPVGSTQSLVNWEALENLPELFSGCVVSVEFKPPKSDKDSGDFEPVGGGMYMPSVDLVNRIADKRGINGLDFGTVVPIYEEIDWHRMTCQFDKPPQLVKYLVGYMVTKQGKTLTEDGTERVCDPCIVSYNAWERVCADSFGKEESATDYYSPEKVKTDGNGSRYYESVWNGEVSKRYLKYDTRAKRQATFDAELKFAMRKADTKARNLVVRVICGMQTGYSAAELAGGVFYLYKIIRSDFAVKSEHAARLAAMSGGYESAPASRALCGPSKTADEVRDVTEPDVTTEPAPVPATVEELATSAASEDYAEDQRAEMIRVLKVYRDELKLVPDAVADTVNKMVAWIEGKPDATKDAIYWPKAISILAEIEKNVMPLMQISGRIKKS